MSEIQQRLASLMIALQEKGTLYNTNKELFNLKNNELQQKLDDLWKGYKRLGIVEETPPETVNVISQEDFILQYNTLLQELNSILEQLPEDKNIPTLIDAGENMIDKILDLTCYRAMSIDAIEDQYLSQIDLIQNQNKSIQASFPANPSLSVLDTFALQSIELGERHVQLLNLCISLQSDLGIIYDIRKLLFDLAQNLFSR